LQTAALAYPALTALLGTSPFRWWDTQLPQSSTFPAVVVQMVSNPATYTFGGRLPTSFARMQFTIWGGYSAAGSQAADQVRSALYAFLDQFNAEGIPGLLQYPCLVVNDRRGGFTQGDTLLYQRLLDVQIFSNDSI
jgi:hypothetical protein